MVAAGDQVKELQHLIMERAMSDVEPSTPCGCHDARLSGSRYARAHIPRVEMGVLLKLKGPCKYSYAEMVVFDLDARSRFKVSWT